MAAKRVSFASKSTISDDDFDTSIHGDRHEQHDVFVSAIGTTKALFKRDAAVCGCIERVTDVTIRPAHDASQKSGSVRRYVSLISRSAWRDSLTSNSSSDSMTSNSDLSEFGDAAPTTGLIPQRCLRQWQRRLHLHDLPYYHGILELDDAARLLMQPGISNGTFLLHFLPVDANGKSYLKLVLSFLKKEHVSHRALRIDGAGIHVQQMRFSDIASVIQAARLGQVKSVCAMGYLPSCFQSTPDYL